VLAARHYFRDHLPEAYAGAIAFFDPAAYNVAITIQENVIFGKIAYGQAQAPQRMAELLTELLDTLDLRPGVMAVGLDSPVGIGGGRLSMAQRQKLGLARALVKRPDILVLYDPLGPLDQREQLELRDALLEACAGRTIIWALQHDGWASLFDRVIELDEGRLVREGPPGGGGRRAESPALVNAE
jgi:putative ABC transport system ATP-binding protein